MKIDKMKDYHQLLTKFYIKNNPNKISEVSYLLQKYEGQEEELFTKLYIKYNENKLYNENSVNAKDYKKLLTDFYSKFNPTKISKVADLLSKYEGQEEELLNKLYEKYNVNQEKPIQEEFIEPKQDRGLEPTQQKPVQDNSFSNIPTAFVKNNITQKSMNNKKLFLIVGISVLIIAVSIIGVKQFLFKPISGCDEFLMGYESYVNNLIEIKKKIEQNPNDLKFVSEYNILQSKAAKWNQIPDDCQKDQEFMRKYIDFQSKQPTKIKNESQVNLNSGISIEEQENLPDTTIEEEELLNDQNQNNEEIAIDQEQENSNQSNDADDKTLITVAPIDDAKEEAEEVDQVFFMVEEMPEFPGGEMALRAYIANAIKYPVIAKENGIQGKVYVTFVIGKDGSISKATISRGVDTSLDKEALRVVNLMPKWKPGKQSGEPVNVSYTIPINFSL